MYKHNPYIMRRFFFRVMLIACIPLLGGCKGTIVEEEPIIELRYINNTDHSMHLKMSWYLQTNTVPCPEREFLSVDIPAGSQFYIDFALGSYHGATFSSCSISFDDGKVLKYHVDIPNGYDGRGVISKDPLSPLSPNAYSVEVNGDMVIRSFTFTDEHYKLAE